MTAPASKVDIWNIALDNVGETAEIESESDDRQAAEICRRHYDKLLRELLAKGSFPWRWAMMQAAATTVDDDTGAEITRVGWQHVYALPADCVTPVALLYGDTRIDLLAIQSRAAWDIMSNDAKDGQVLVADFEVGLIDAIEYVALVDYVPAMPAMFQEALALRLASVLAKALPKDIQKSRLLKAESDQALDAARAESENNSSVPYQAMTPSELARR